jgi:hypothetical protein
VTEAGPIGVLLAHINDIQSKIDALKRHQAETAASPGLPPAVQDPGLPGRALDIYFVFAF